MNGLYDLGPVVAVPLLVLRYAHAMGGLGVTSHGRQADWLTENTPVNPRPSLMIIVSWTQFHVERLWGQCPFSIVS